MNDLSINSISNAGLVDAGTNASRVGGPDQMDPAAPRSPAPVKAGPLALKPAAPPAWDPAALKAGAPALQEQQDPRQILPVTNGSNVEIHFRVDRHTKNVTVFVVDRESKRVLRSIPPEELNKLQPGDLMEMTG